MQDEFPKLSQDEQLKAENDILKMKLMLEKGAEFHTIKDGEIDPKIEHEFLNYISEFERQSMNPVFIKVFDKLGQPDHFKPVAEISDEEIGAAWKSLSVFLNEHQISLDVCSPNISVRELYRFVTEELFGYEMDDMNIPGMMTGFIYDEFHPDAVYDNTRTAVEDCIHYILEKNPMDWMYNFFAEDLRLNQHEKLKAVEFREIVNRFKLSYTELSVNNITCTGCVVNEADSIVTGNYSLLADSGKGSEVVSGNWKVIFGTNPDHGNWDVAAVEIEGIVF